MTSEPLWIGFDLGTQSVRALVACDSTSGTVLLLDGGHRPVSPALMYDDSRAAAEAELVDRRGADATGLPAGTPVIAGMTDGCAAQIGAGALEPGEWNSALGTTLVLKGVTPELVRDPSRVMYSHRSPDGDWLPGGASSTYGIARTAVIATAS